MNLRIIGLSPIVNAVQRKGEHLTYDLDRRSVLNGCNGSRVYGLALAEQERVLLPRGGPTVKHKSCYASGNGTGAHSFANHCNAVAPLVVVYEMVTVVVDPAFKPDGRATWRAEPITGCLSPTSYWDERTSVIAQELENVNAYSG